MFVAQNVPPIPFSVSRGEKGVVQVQIEHPLLAPMAHARPRTIKPFAGLDCNARASWASLLLHRVLNSLYAQREVIDSVHIAEGQLEINLIGDIDVPVIEHLVARGIRHGDRPVPGQPLARGLTY